MPVEAFFYSVDTSALIRLKQHYPKDLSYFLPIWDYIGRLSNEGRLFIPEEVKSECEDEVLKNMFKEYSHIIYPTAGDLTDYMIAFQDELDKARLFLVDPESTKNRADPFVVALALTIERRNLKDLKKDAAATCHVISYETITNFLKLSEKDRNLIKKNTRISIPDACSIFNIDHIDWPEFIRRENFSGPAVG